MREDLPSNRFKRSTVGTKAADSAEGAEVADSESFQSVESQGNEVTQYSQVKCKRIRNTIMSTNGETAVASLLNLSIKVYDDMNIFPPDMMVRKV